MEWPDWLESWDRATFLDIHRGLHALDSPMLDGYLRWTNELGSGFVLVTVVGLCVALGLSFRSSLRGLAQAGLAIALSTLVTHLIKGWLDHPRPGRVFATGFADGDLVLAFGTPVREQAFPSGHTATAFALALLVSAWATDIRSTPRRWFVRTLVFLLAGSTALARVYGGVHFPTDVISGAIVGLLCAMLALRLVRRPVLDAAGPLNPPATPPPTAT
ncbi:MAG TPA: phosphatase PAP2 family protein [Planctomycetota bacterium]|nr:phosphatase PAP2 family protein [Planctomycetota bacterium]